MIFSGGCQETKDQKSLFVFLFYFLSIGISLKKRKCLIFLHSHLVKCLVRSAPPSEYKLMHVTPSPSMWKKIGGETNELMVWIIWFLPHYLDTNLPNLILWKKFDNFSNAWQVLKHLSFQVIIERFGYCAI